MPIDHFLSFDLDRGRVVRRAVPRALGFVTSRRASRLVSCFLSLLIVTATIAAKPTDIRSAPAQQDEPIPALYLPLNFQGLSLESLATARPAPSRTPSPSAMPATAEPTTSATASPTVTAGPEPSATPQPLPPIEIEGDWVRTPHYALLSPSPAIDKQELGWMMEQYFEQAADYFGAEPEGEERLVGRIFADAASYRAGLEADGIPSSAGGSGGYYSPRTRSFYLFVQPSRHYTRMLTLHEATHQMQHLAGGCSNPGWWTEGEAEHLGMHVWDGQHLQLARQPLISLEDHPKSALESFRSKGEDLGYIVRGQEGWNYREVWGLVSFLRDELPEAFDDLRGRYCAGEGSEAGWQAVFDGPVDAAMNADYEAWLEANQQPWTWVWNDFEPWGASGMHGLAEVNALAVTKERPDVLEVEIEALSEALRAGIVVAYHGTEDFVMLRLYADRRLEVIRVSEGFRWEWLAQRRAPDPPAGQLDRMGARVEGEQLHLSMNGETVYTLEDPRDLAGRFGMNLEGCEIRVRVLP